jgi:DNA processing protein
LEMSDDQLRSYLRLHLADGVGAVLFRRLADAFGGVTEAIAAGAGGWRKVQGVGPKTASSIAAVTDEQIDAELAEAESRSVEILCDTDERYPAALKAIYDRPPMLYVRGSLTVTDAVALGVVGARRCTHYGLEQAGRFGELLARAGFTVVSGGARGIDTAAHRGALNAGGRTIAVMGCGLSTDYPPENAGLFEQIVSERRGAIVSELPMKTAVLSGNFPTRNRIISGLSLGVLVVEAARRSGALITAREASEQGREVFAVPGRADSLMSHGVNALIRDGAILVQNLDDILEHLGAVGAKMELESEQGEFVTPAGLSEIETKLLEVLSESPLELDELVRRSGCTSAEVVSSMTMLVLKGAATQRAGNVFARKQTGSQTGNAKSGDDSQ